jgi:hypothetical protein
MAAFLRGSFGLGEQVYENDGIMHGTSASRDGHLSQVSHSVRLELSPKKLGFVTVVGESGETMVAQDVDNGCST